MTDPGELLRRLVREATVRIQAPLDGYATEGPDRAGAGAAPEIWGSGFFVAPGWVLTCAHVLMREEEVGAKVWKGDSCIGLSFAGGTAVGKLECALPGPEALGPAHRGLWPYPDLALIRVLDDLDHPCVWMSHQAPVSGSELSFHGFRQVSGTVDGWDGRCRYRGVWGDQGIRVGDDEIPQGASGGPVVDLARGAVCGVVKAQRTSRNVVGGLVVPITGLRRLPELRAPDAAVPVDPYQTLWRGHDRHHHERQRGACPGNWTELHQRLAPAVPEKLGPAHRTDMLGLLASLPPPQAPATVARLVRQARGDDWQRPELHLRTWRDGAGMLYDPPGQSELLAFLRYCSLVADSVVEADPEGTRTLREWIARAADVFPDSVRRTLLPRRAASGGHVPRSSVLLRLDRAAWGEDLFTWQVAVLDGSGVLHPGRHDDHGTRQEELEERLREPLTEAFRSTDEGQYLAPLEVVLPLDLFDIPVDEWQLVKGKDAAGRTLAASVPLGVRRPVVIRDLVRFGDGRIPEWWQRWHGVRSGPMRVLDVHLDGGAVDPDDLQARMRAAPLSGVPVLCGPVGSEPGFTVMDAASAAGHGIALWRRCPEPGSPEPDGDPEQDRGCAEFHQGVTHLIGSGVPAEDLPAAVCKLRTRARIKDSDARWSTGIALLYDDPSRPSGASEEPLRQP